MKMFDYIETIFCIYNVINLNSDKKQDVKMKAFAILLYNYVIELALRNKINVAEIKRPKEIQMAPLYDYVKLKNIQVYSLTSLSDDTLDFKKNGVLEAFILSQIFHIFKLHV
jgi:hypothetical protein